MEATHNTDPGEKNLLEKKNKASCLDIQKSLKNNKVKPRKRGELRLKIPETELSGDTQTKVKFGKIRL